LTPRLLRDSISDIEIKAMAGSFEERVLLLNNLFYHLFQKRFSTEKSACMNSPLSTLSYNDLKVLETIEMNGKLTMGCLSEELHLAMSTLTGITDKLVQKEFLERTRSDADRRVVEVRLTDKGHKAFAYRKSAHETISRNILSTLTNREQDLLLRLLKKVISS